MLYALSLLDDLDCIERLIKPVDEVIYKIMKEEIGGQYAEACAVVTESLGVMETLINLQIFKDREQSEN
jgi:hypothetical protein